MLYSYCSADHENSTQFNSDAAYTPSYVLYVNVDGINGSAWLYDGCQRVITCYSVWCLQKYKPGLRRFYVTTQFLLRRHSSSKTLYKVIRPKVSRRDTRNLKQFCKCKCENFVSHVKRVISKVLCTGQWANFAGTLVYSQAVPSRWILLKVHSYWLLFKTFL